MIDFVRAFFDEPVERTLFYSPKIEIKPAHLANGFFRAACGVYANAILQHQAIYPKAYPDPPRLPEYLRGKSHADARGMLHALLTADGTVFRKVDHSSYSSTHVSHLTRDHHDQHTGEWLSAILEHDAGAGPSPALALIRSLLTQNDRQRSDELSTLTIPLVPEEETPLHQFASACGTRAPSSLSVDANGNFRDPVITAIRRGFDCIALHEGNTARYGGKLDTLRRLVTWGCFAVYLHLANIGRIEPASRLPMLLCLTDSPGLTLRQASIQSYQWVSRLIDRFLRQEVRAVVERLSESDEASDWNDENIEAHITTMMWQPTRGGMRKYESTQASFSPDCLNFYRSYRGGTAQQPPKETFANAVTDMLDRVLSSSPADIARSLGMRIGLLTTYGQRTRKLYKPLPDLLEVLVRASVLPGEQWPLEQLASFWANEYGLLVGALGDDNTRLAAWGISAVDGVELAENVDALALTLELSGYARRYADGVVLVNVRGDVQ